MSTARVCEAAEAFRRGWAITPLRGKIPVLPGWQVLPRPTMAQAIAWARAGNIGIRTGRVSGIVVIDVDSAKGGDASRLGLPPTVTVRTGGGGLHHYFRHPGGSVANSVGRLARHVDVRGDGGQVVFVGSEHPQTLRPYAWATNRSPENIPVADLPKEVLNQIRAAGNSANCANSAKTFPTSSHAGVSTPYGKASLSGEALAVQLAPCGTRNDRLNRAAFRLGQLVARGHLFEQEVILRLSWAAEVCGLDASEAARTIRSGLCAARREVRR